MNRLFTCMAALITTWITGYLLIVGRGFIIPIIVALFIWNLLNTIINGFEKIPTIGEKLPHWLRMLLSLAIVGGLVKILIDIIANNVNDVIAASTVIKKT